MSLKKIIDTDLLAYFLAKVKNLIPTKTSDLTNDSGFITSDTSRVAKSGDTMTGNLIVTNNAPIRSIDTTITVGISPSQGHISSGMQFGDKDGTLFGYCRPIYFSDGRLGVTMSAYRTIGSSTLSNVFGVFVNDSGNPVVYTSAPAAWRSALGVVPTTRTINGKALSANITLSASDVGAVPTTGTATKTGRLIIDENGGLTLKDTWSVMEFPLPSVGVEYGYGVALADTNGVIVGNLRNFRNSDEVFGVYLGARRELDDVKNNYITLGVNNTGSAYVNISAPATWRTALGAVPTSRTINGKALSSNITLTASDVSALAANDSTVVHIGSQVIGSSGANISTATNGGYVEVTVTVPSGATLVGALVKKTATDVYIFGYALSGNTTVRIHARSASGLAASYIQVRPLYIF